MSSPLLVPVVEEVPSNKMDKPKRGKSGKNKGK